MTKTRISVSGINPMSLCGRLDENFRILSKNYDVTLVLRGKYIFLQGEQYNVEQLKIKILSLIRKIKSEGSITKEDLESGNKIYTSQKTINNKYCWNGPDTREPQDKFKNIVTPRTDGQAIYLKALNSFDIVICIGPAGTGKTYLAVAKAVELLRNNSIRKIILARPAVEAGERLGFLPGDFKEKVDPYLAPLYDALYELMPREKVRHYIEDHIIEILPLAYMRGRNLDNSFIILDEAQNATKMQMKMFLTRLGIGSKACITGDSTQIDLKSNEDSGLLHVQSILKNIIGIKFIQLTSKDIVRHPLVEKIVKAYEKESKL